MSLSERFKHYARSVKDAITSKDPDAKALEYLMSLARFERRVVVDLAQTLEQNIQSTDILATLIGLGSVARSGGQEPKTLDGYFEKPQDDIDILILLDLPIGERKHPQARAYVTNVVKTFLNTHPTLRVLPYTQAGKNITPTIIHPTMALDMDYSGTHDDDITTATAMSNETPSLYDISASFRHLSLQYQPIRPLHVSIASPLDPIMTARQIISRMDVIRIEADNPDNKLNFAVLQRPLSSMQTSV